MEVAITKMSRNGQIVIPSEIRKDAKIKPSSKFLVMNEGGDIYLKQITSERLKAEMELRRDIREGEDDIKKGRYVKVKKGMSFEEVDKLLTG